MFCVDALFVLIERSLVCPPPASTIQLIVTYLMYWKDEVFEFDVVAGSLAGGNSSPCCPQVLQHKMKEKRRPSVSWMDHNRMTNTSGRPATPSAGSSPLYPEYRLEESIRNRRPRTGSFRYHVDLDDAASTGSGQELDYLVNKVSLTC